MQSRARAITSTDTPQTRPPVLVTPNRKWSSGGEWRVGGGGTSWRHGGATVHRSPPTGPSSTGADEPRLGDDRIPCGANPRDPPTGQVGHTQEIAPRNALEVPGRANLEKSNIPWGLPPRMRIDVPSRQLSWITPPIDPSLGDHPANGYDTGHGWNQAGETWEGVLTRWAGSTFHDGDESSDGTFDGWGALSTLGMASAWGMKNLDIDSGALYEDPKSFGSGTNTESKVAAQPYGLVEDVSTRKMENGAGSVCTRPEIPLDQLRLRSACGFAHVAWGVTQSSDISKYGVPHYRNGLYQVGFLLTYKWCVS